MNGLMPVVSAAPLTAVTSIATSIEYEPVPTFCTITDVASATGLTRAPFWITQFVPVPAIAVHTAGNAVPVANGSYDTSTSPASAGRGSQPSPMPSLSLSTSAPVAPERCGHG